MSQEEEVVQQPSLLFERRKKKILALYASICSQPKLEVGDVMTLVPELINERTIFLSYSPGIVTRVYDKPIYSSRV